MNDNEIIFELTVKLFPLTQPELEAIFSRWKQLKQAGEDMEEFVMAVAMVAFTRMRRPGCCR